MENTCRIDSKHSRGPNNNDTAENLAELYYINELTCGRPLAGISEGLRVGIRSHHREEFMY